MLIWLAIAVTSQLGLPSTTTLPISW